MVGDDPDHSAAVARCPRGGYPASVTMKTIDIIRDRLLELHKAVVDEERRAYERAEGKTTAGEFLEVLVSDERCAWLRPFTSLVVALDDEETGADGHAAWLSRARALLRPDAEGDAFQRRYDELVQSSPDILVAHGAAMRALGALTN